MKFTAAQCRAARALLHLSQADVAMAAGVGLSTLRDFETGSGTPMEENVSRILATLEKAGIEFLYATPTRGEGVRFRAPA